MKRNFVAMLKHYGLARSIGLLTIGLLLATAPTMALAQEDAGPAWVNFRIHTVKPDQTAAWESLMKERRDAEEAAGTPFRRVFQRVRGPQSTYLILHLDGAVGQTDLPAVDISPTWGTRLNSTLASSTLLTVQMPPELTANEEGWLARDTDLLRVRIRTNAPGRTQDYYDWQANQLIPALSEAGVSIRTGRVSLGASDRTWVRLTAVGDWASVTETNPAFESPEFQRMIAAGDTMIVATEDLMYQYRADLSFPNN